MEKEFYSVKQFAELLGMNPQTIRKSIRNGRIQAFKVGVGEKASYRISKTEAQRLGIFDLRKIIKNLYHEIKDDESI